MSNKTEFYRALLGKVFRRLPFGIAAASLFLVFWYLWGGDILWGHFLAFWMKLFGLFFESGFAPDPEHPAFFYVFEVGGASHEIGFKLNQLNSNLVVIVTLLVMLPQRDFKSGLKLWAWSLLLTLLYQTFSFWIQCYGAAIGPAVADKYGVFWEETTWYHFIRKVGNFDKFILRYYGAFPIVGLALMLRYFTDKTTDPVPEQPKKKPKKK